MKWELRLAKRAARELRRLPRGDQALIVERLTQLEEDPFRGDVRPLKGKAHKGRYRARVGRYRIIFTPEIEKHVIGVSAILRRAEKMYR